MLVLRSVVLTVLLLQASAANALLWTTNEVIIHREGEGLVSRYRAGYTDTFGAFEEFLLVDCNSNIYQGYMLIHSDVFDDRNTAEFTIKTDAKIDAFLVQFEKIWALKENISFDALETLSEDIGAMAQYGPNLSQGPETMSRLCEVVGFSSGRWKVK